eukprot:6443100-Prymnesium_polylepis.1
MQPSDRKGARAGSSIARLTKSGNGQRHAKLSSAVPTTGFASHAPGTLELHTECVVPSMVVYDSPQRLNVTLGNARGEASAAAEHRASGVN